MQVVTSLAVKNKGGKVAGCVGAQKGLQNGGGARVGQAPVSGIQLDIPKNLSIRLCKAEGFLSQACSFYPFL